MVLCVDAGNRFVKYALVSRGRLIRLGRRDTRDPARLVSGMRRYAGELARVEGVVVSSVVPSLNARLARTLRGVTGRTPLFVGYRSPLPFRLAVAAPSRLGVDRICAASGAVRRGARSAVVVDVGSAVTVDLVARGVFRGGIILAGPALALHALSAHTEQLPDIDPARLLARGQRFDSTEAAMISGATVGGAGAIREAVRFVSRSLPRRPRVYLTGGGAPALVRHLPRSWRVDPDLVHKGLHELWRLEQRRRRHT
jgi:type III pantothenate kinase